MPCNVLTPAMILNSYPETCAEVPTPADPNVSSPGFALASPISSGTLATPTDGFTTGMFGASTARTTGVRSFAKSKGSSLIAPLTTFARSP